VKYSVKGSDLLESPDPVGPMIRVLEKTRLVTTFGNFFGRGAEFDEAAAGEKAECSKCHEQGAFIPTDIIHYLTRR